MRVHAINTATMTVKRNYVESKGGMYPARLMSAMMDSEWRDVPVYAWVIEHPEGLIVIDTGETAQVHDPGYFPLYQRPFWMSQYRWTIGPMDEIGPQMRALGLSPSDVRWVILTHTHLDHTDGLYHFPHAEFFITDKELIDTYRWRSLHFTFPAKWGGDIPFHVVHFLPQPVGSFATSYPVTKAGDVVLVPTPGHTLGHQSVLLHDGDQTIFFGGDTSFDLRSLLDGTLDAPAFSSILTHETRRKIRVLADNRPLVYLTTHDPETANRLEMRVVVPSRQNLEPMG